MTAFPSGEANAVTYDATISSSTGVTFNAATKEIEVTAVDKGIFMNWGTVAASSTVFDNFIPANTSKRFAISSQTGATFIEQAATAILVVIEK
jgi:hypothetical protein